MARSAAGPPQKLRSAGRDGGRPKRSGKNPTKTPENPHRIARAQVNFCKRHAKPRARRQNLDSGQLAAEILLPMCAVEWVRHEYEATTASDNHKNTRIQMTWNVQQAAWMSEQDARTAEVRGPATRAQPPPYTENLLSSVLRGAV